MDEEKTKRKYVRCTGVCSPELMRMSYATKERENTYSSDWVFVVAFIMFVFVGIALMFKKNSELVPVGPAVSNEVLECR